MNEKYPEPSMVPGSEPRTAESKRTLHRSILGSALGNSVEWFDYEVYWYLTIYMAVNFFGPQRAMAVWASR